MNQNITKKALTQAIFTQLTDSERQIFDYMLQFSIKNNSNFVSQSRISLKFQRSIRTINRMISKFYNLGLIVSKKQRGFNKTCQYVMNSMIFEFKEMLSQVLPSLKWCKRVIQSAISDVNGVLCIKGVNLSKFSSSLLKSLCINPPQLATYSDLYHRAVDTTLHFVESSLPSASQIRYFKKILEEKIPSKGRKMNATPTPPTISPTLQRITDALMLTQAGQIKLLVFPQAALEATFAQYKLMKNLKDPYFWFTTYAKGYCLQHNLHIDWDLWPILKNKYNISKDMPSVRPVPIKKPQFVSVEDDIKDDEYYKQEALKVEKVRLQGGLGKGFEFSYPTFIKEDNEDIHHKR